MQHLIEQYDRSPERANAVTQRPPSDVTLLHFEKIEPMVPITSILPHGEATHYLENLIADQAAEANIGTYLINLGLYETNQAVEALLRDADIVSFSTSGFFPYEMPTADRIWRQSDAIAVVAAGNKGSISAINEIFSYDFSPINRAEKVLRIGSSKTGMAYDYSSPNAPSLVARSPFDHGTPWPGEDITPAQMSERLQEHREKFAPLFADDPEQMKVFERRIKAARAEHFMTMGLAHKGNVHYIKGTSFAIIPVATHLAAARHLYPNLSSFDLIAAALGSANPVTHLYWGRTRAKLKTIAMGRGLTINENYAGFGEFNPERFLAHAKWMSQRLDQDEKLQSKSMRRILIPIQDEENPNLYRFTVDQDDLFLRLLIRATYQKFQHTPITLKSPEGVKINLSYAPHPKLQLLDITTDKFFGQPAQGIWELEFHGYSKQIALEDAALLTTQKNGLIDDYLAWRATQPTQ